MIRLIAPPLSLSFSLSGGWQALSSTNRLQNWDYKSALKHLQTKFGVFPYYRVSVENSYTMPYDYIITLDEGELGLPDKYFYAAHADEEVVRGYKLLLRDFAINMGKSCEPRDLRFDLTKSTYFSPLPGIVSREADLFADDIFHYERRIVNHLESARAAAGGGSERQVNKLLRLAEMKTIAPSVRSAASQSSDSSSSLT